MAKWVGTWPGGRISEREGGRKTWHLEQRVGLSRYERSFRSEDEALAELAMFRRDPIEYVRAQKAVAESVKSGVGCDAATVDAFLAFKKSEGRGLLYRRNLRTYLKAWSENLRGRDLRTVTVGELKAALREWGTADQHRIIALKSFCSYLREEINVLSQNTDPTLTLKVPQPKPEKATRAKGHTARHVETIYRHVAEQDVRDVICLRAKTGMHEKEAGRILTGDAVITDATDAGEIAGTVRFVHKSGRIHIQSLDAQALAAAKRIAEYGRQQRAAVARGERDAPHHPGIDNARQHRCIKAAAARATAKAKRRGGETVEPIRPGELRHTFVTLGHGRGVEIRPAEGGVPLTLIAETIGHSSKRTTSRYYDGTTVPLMIRLPLRLFHPDDPPISRPGRGKSRRRPSSVSAAASSGRAGQGRPSGSRTAPAKRP